MTKTKYDEGREAFAAGTAAEGNPYGGASKAHSEWLRGWSDASLEAEEGAAPAEAPPAAVEPLAEAPPAAVEPPVEEPPAKPLGEAGYDRIMELLEHPPLGDLPDGVVLPPDGEVPEDLAAWLKAWKQPLALLTVDTALRAVSFRINGASRGRLRELYRGMSPEQVSAAMQANADVIAGFADQRAAEAGLLNSMQTALTEKAASYLLTALSLV
jgi:hypothetical protein